MILKLEFEVKNDYMDTLASFWFSSFNVIKLLFWFIILAEALNLRISRYILARCPLHLGFLEKLVLKFILHRN